MRFLKIASAKNPDTDYILLNGGYFDKKGNNSTSFNTFSGLLCTSFQSFGISRKLEFLAIKNRQFAVKNEPNFKKYNLTVEILSKYSEYDDFYKTLTLFFDRNKKSGFRLYFRPYGNKEEDIRYCLCDIENVSKAEKMQPILITFCQNSLWMTDEKRATTSQLEQEGNLFAFKEDEDLTNYYSSGFYSDEDINNYYCVSFYNGFNAVAEISNKSFNKVPLNIKINGPCVNPSVFLYRKGDNNAIKQFQIFANINKGYHIDINANISDSGVWRVKTSSGEKTDLTDLLNNETSPYFYIDNGDYTIKVVDAGNNVCETYVYWQEEFDE